MEDGRHCDPQVRPPNPAASAPVRRYCGVKEGVMRRFFYAAAVAAAAMCVFAGAASAANIYAGQNMLAGTVTGHVVGADLVVDISIDSGWCMTSSAVAAAYNDDLLPTTKKGNPIPGQFPFKTTYAGCVQSGSYTIPLSGIPGGSASLIYIAAHVDLFSTTVNTMDVVSHAGQNVYGPLYAYAGYADPAWGSPIAAVVPTFASAGVWPTLAGASYISTALLTEMNAAISTVYAPDAWRMTKVDLVPPAGSYLLGGEVTLLANADNAQRVWLNNTTLSPSSGSQGMVEGMCTDTHQWNSIDTYEFTPVAGTNTLAFVWRNFGLGALCGLQYSQTSDPTGLIYKATISYYSPTNHNETGWAAGTGSNEVGYPFWGSNWATYFSIPAS